MNVKHVSICTAGLAIALSMNAQALHAASHCQGLAEVICGQSAACRWVPARAVGDMTKAGNKAKTAAKAHCRLDVRKAAELAAKITAERK